MAELCEPAAHVFGWAEITAHHPEPGQVTHESACVVCGVVRLQVFDLERVMVVAREFRNPEEAGHG